MKIGVKLATMITIFNIIGISLLAGVTLIESQQEITRLAEGQARSIARESSEKIKNWFEEYMGAARAFAHIMEGYKEIPVERRREEFNMMMRQILSGNPKLRGVYANWAPNALDAMDEDYANTPGNDRTGRFIPAWSNIAGKLVVDAIVGFNWDIIMQIPGFKTEYVLDPAVYPASDGDILVANMGAPVKDNGVLVGLSGVSLELSTVQAMVEEIKPLGDGHALVFSSGGIVAAHHDPQRLGKNMRESETDTFGSFLNTMVDAVTTGTAASFSYQSPQSDTIYHYYSVPFTIGNVPMPWTLVIGVSHNTIMAPVYRMLRICLLIGLFTIILMSTGVMITARSISRPIAYTMTMLKDIAEGDLTKDITVHSKDEVGDLARYLNFAVDRIENLVVSIRKKAESLSQTGTDLAENMTETAVSINEITANIQSIKSQTNQQATGIKKANTIMREVVDHINVINGQIEKQTDCVSESSSAVEQMLANIQSVTETLVKNKTNVTKLAQASEVGQNGLQEVAGSIREIARDSEGLLEINTVMKNIASQTNLLSMNAAIEAAHAGEAGQGFAVVANEIRKLAESSSEQSKTISEVLKKIKNSIDKISQSTEDVLLNFETIQEGVQTVTEQEGNVRKAMEEQGMGSKAILKSIGSLNEISGEVKQSAQGMLGGSGKVIQEGDTLEQITEEIENGVREMASGAEQIDTAVNRVNDISAENKKQIEQLMGEVSRFKIE
ncbi:MAG: methyl-accepting chemotaxis protein [Treponema sp.]|jgi:methyl-accepting chemotaxis protein|nr:methyl-accepting chemotaxis protein [Treponema sp.]